MALGDTGGASLIARRAAREPLPDALRALALAGVLVVNGMGYQGMPIGRLLGEVEPAHSPWAFVAHWAVAAFVQGKAYPVLAFLFGMGLAYSARGLPADTALAASRRRARRLLLLGVLHGVLLYFGDILTLYALCGWWVARQVREPWRMLRPRLKRAFGWAVLCLLASMALVSVMMESGPAPAGSTIGDAPGFGAFLAINASLYASAQVFALVFALPLVRLCMLLGIGAVRLRLLTHRRWRDRIESSLSRWWWPVLALNVAGGAAYVLAPLGAAPAIETVNALWTLPLAALYVAQAACAWHRGRRVWVSRLQSLGQHTLSVYVFASFLMLLLFSGGGLALRPGSVGWVALALGLWTAAWLASRRLPGRWPLEVWMARR